MDGNHINMLDECRGELNKIKTRITEDRFHSTVQYLICYSIVRICGTYEVIFKEMLYNHLTIDANEENRRFLRKNILDSSSNPNTGNIGSYLEKINDDWKDSFNTQTKDTEAKQNLNALVKFRNDFAHGRGIQCSIENVIRYFEESIRVLDILYNIIHNNEAV